MLIRYQPKQDHIKCVTLTQTTDDLKKIKLTRTQIQLLPGVNEVTDDEWKVMQVHLAREITAKVIVPIIREVPKSKRAPSGKAQNLNQYPPDKAVALVKECVNPDTLKKWYQEETREEVRLVIVKKMEELKVEIPDFKGPEVTDDEGTGNTDSSTDTENGSGASGSTDNK
jgi:hypothetical protein